MDERKRLLVLVSPDGEAQKRDTFERCDAWRERFEVRVICGRGEVAAFAALGVPVTAWKPAGIIGMGRAIATLRKTTLAFDPSAIVANGWAPASVALGTYPARYASRTIVYFHDPLRGIELPSRQVDRRFPKYLARAAALACTYPTLAQAIEVRFDLGEGALAIVPHGVVADLETSELARPPSRPGPIVGWYGALDADRAWQTAIDAFAEIRKAAPDASMIVAGDGKARQFVAGHARQRNVADRVTFERNSGSRELFAKIDLLLVPQSRDAQPHVLLEALAYGVPVVAANVGALADALEDVETGWLVPDDREGLCEGALDAWTQIDDAWKGAMAQRGAARERYSRARVDAELTALFERISES